MHFVKFLICTKAIGDLTPLNGAFCVEIDKNTKPIITVSDPRAMPDNREFTKPGRQRQPEHHLEFRKASLVSVRYI